MLRMKGSSKALVFSLTRTYLRAQEARACREQRATQRTAERRSGSRRSGSGKRVHARGAKGEEKGEKKGGQDGARTPLR